MDSSYILFSGTPNPSSFCIHTLLYRVIVNSAAKLQSGCDKNWHREKKRWRGKIKLQMKYIRQKVPSPANVLLFLCWPHVCLQLCLLPYFQEKLLKKFYGCMQAHEEEYSSGSVSQLKWFNQATQVVQLASSDVSVSWCRRLDKLTDTSPLAYAAIFVTQCCHIRNPTQPYL